MKEFSKLKTTILYIILTILIALLFVVTLSWIGYEFKWLYKIPTNSDSTNLLGNLSSGLIGGVGTIIAVLISINQTDKIQRQNQEQYIKDQQLHQEEYLKDIEQHKKDKQHEFANEIMDLVSKYATDISLYLAETQKKLWIQKDLKKSSNLKSKKILEHQLDKLIPNRSISVECRYALRLRLQNNTSAKDLLDWLEFIHETDECIDSETFNSHIQRLLDITYDFCQNYIDHNSFNNK